MVVSMIADDRALEEIVGGPEGILAASARVSTSP